jgi:hypothetical protein
MKSLEEQVRLLKARNANGGNGGNDGAGGFGGKDGGGGFVPCARRRCLKCMRMGHMAADCRTPDAIAARMKQEYYDNLRAGGDGDGGAGANPPADGGAPAGGDGN